MISLVRKELGLRENEAIPRLLKSYPQLLVSSGIISDREYESYFLGRQQHFLCQDKRNHLLIAKKRVIVGMALLRFMQWDSNFFKIPIGSVEYILVNQNENLEEICELERKLLYDSVNLAKRVGIKILYTSVNSARHSFINSLNFLKFNFICGEMEGMIRKNDLPCLKMKEKIDSKYKFRRYQKKDYSQIIKIGKEISEDLDSKFILTPYLPQKEKKDYYPENIKNCCLGKNADEIFVAEKNRVVVGFVCYRYDRIFKETIGRKSAFLSIGGTLRAERRKNTGTYLFANAHRQILRESEAISWKVYLHNLPMIRFILKRGFIPPFNFTYTFCKKIII